MKLNGIATALYESEGNTLLSLTTLSSESAEEIFIEKTEKTKFSALDHKAMRRAFMPLLDEICAQPVQQATIRAGKFEGKPAQVPVAIIYGTPEKYPGATYSTILQIAFPEYFAGGNLKRADFHELLESLFLAHLARGGKPGTRIEMKPFYLYMPVCGPAPAGKKFTEEDAGKEFGRLHEAAESGDAEAHAILRGYAINAAQEYLMEIRARGIEIPRFIQYGPRNDNLQGTNKYTALGWYDLRDIFVRELARYMPIPHNVCVKTPNDMPAPPFADICATQLADYWDILNGNPQKRHVFARVSRV